MEQPVSNNDNINSKMEIFLENSISKNPPMKIIVEDNRDKIKKSFEVKSGFHLEKYVKSLHPEEKNNIKILTIFQKGIAFIVDRNYDDTIINSYFDIIPFNPSCHSKNDNIYKYIEIDHIERFISDEPFKIPPMIMCIKDNKKKIINIFKIPPSFQLEIYVKSLYPNDMIKQRKQNSLNGQQILIIDVIKNDEIIESYWGHYYYIWIDVREKLNNELIKSYSGYYLIDN